MGKRKSLRQRMISKTFDMLPDKGRFHLIRKKFKLDYELPEGFTFEIAKSKEDLEGAFGLLYAAYLEEKLISPNSSEIRVTKYHAAPTTTALVAKYNGEVAATISVITDSKLGLPADAAFDLAPLRQRDLRIVEVSALAIKKSFRKLRGRMLLPLCKYMYQYAYHYASADALVATTNRQVSDFYRALFLFEPLKEKKKIDYKFVNDALPGCQYLDLTTAHERWQATFGQCEDEFNMHKYLVEHQFSEFKFPERRYHKCMDPVMTPQLLDYFFNRTTPVMDQLSEDEKIAISNFYNLSSYDNVVGKCLRDLGHQRSNARFSAKLDGTVMDAQKGTIDPAKVRDVSLYGLQIRSENPLDLNSRVTLHVRISDDTTVKLEGECVWKRQDQFYGIRIIKVVGDRWFDYVSEMEQDLIGDTAIETRKLSVSR